MLLQLTHTRTSAAKCPCSQCKKCIDRQLIGLLLIRTMNEQLLYGPSIQDNLGELVVSQRRDLLEQAAGCPSCHSAYSVKALQETQWFGRLLFYRHGISTAYLTNSVKALKEATHMPTDRLQHVTHIIIIIVIVIITHFCCYSAF